MEEHLKKLRQAELEAVRGYFKAGVRVLEIGGGSGYQASVLTSWGCEVASLDVPERPASTEIYYPVQDYDGRHFPFQNESFDIVFSSNVLEHIGDLPNLFAEIRRVIKPGHLAVHIVPSATWRFWTILTHYPFLLRRLLAPSARTLGRVKQISIREKASQRGWAYALTRILFPGPHGEYPNAISELYYFSRARWTRVFERNRFEVVSVTGNQLFYTGYMVCPGLSFHVRRTLARALGSACHVFVTRAGSD